MKVELEGRLMGVRQSDDGKLFFGELLQGGGNGNSGSDRSEVVAFYGDFEVLEHLRMAEELTPVSVVARVYARPFGKSAQLSVKVLECVVR